ncbi:hypothetical protein ZIOFF_012506 [Zingiber officinale]|uniref:Uncharacterized protein n=1 Tax=Zingiber officinale TaxID=94328 RepID=A0A8J5LTZ7_ZINOF|nr:hypothetical protein ZIOFF_012506 [Zingiber officinale]
MQYIHLGILQVCIQTLHRQEGVLALIIFRDNHWMGDQAILATMEVDLTRVLTKPYKAIEENEDYDDNYTQNSKASYQEDPPYILVHKLTKTAVIPKNKMTGAIGFDLAADQSTVIEPKGTSPSSWDDPSWDDKVIEEFKNPNPNWDVLLPKEKHTLSAFFKEEALYPQEASKDLAGTTSPWASVPRSKDPFDVTLEEDSDLFYI